LSEGLEHAASAQQATSNAPAADRAVIQSVVAGRSQVETLGLDTTDGHGHYR
jgi:hypothetical protein